MVVKRSLGMAFLVLMVAAIAGSYVIFEKLIPNPGSRTVWAATTAEPVPPDFLYVMFPKREQVPARDGPAGAEVGVLARALANRHQELRNEAIPFPADGRTLYVNRDDLSFVATTPESSAAAVAALREALRIAEAASALAVEFAPGVGAAPTRLRLANGDAWDEFQYTVNAAGPGEAGAAPVSWTRFSGGGKAIGSAVRLVGSMVLGITASLTLALVVMMFAFFTGRLKPVSAKGTGNA